MARKTKPNQSSRKNGPSQTNQMHASLASEIAALGGNPDSDLSLIEDVLDDSNDEMDNDVTTTPSDQKALVADLEKFMKGTLKLDPKRSVVPDAEEESEVEEHDEQEDYDEVDEDGDEEPDVDDDDEELDELTENLPSDKSTEDSKPMLASLIGNTTPLPASIASRYIVPPNPQWHTITLPKLSPQTKIPSPADVSKIHTRASTLHEADTTAHAKHKRMSHSDRAFVSTVLKSGTVTDKVSALTLLIQDSPLHNLPYLRTNLLNNMARKKSRRETLLAVDATVDLFVGTILPDRKLKYFRDQPLNAPNVTDQHLVVWFYEDSIKNTYFEFIQLLEELSKDPLLFVKSKALSHISTLLSSKPEQEHNLLSLLLNKVGDTDRKIASKTVYLLQTLLTAHPSMALVVIRETERLLFRNNVATRAQYYAVTFLNQIVLTKKDAEVATRLVEVYFGLFEMLVRRMREGEGKGEEKKEKKARWRDRGKDAKGGGKRGKKAKGNKPNPKKTKEDGVVVDGLDAKMLGALLTGVNRAFPYATIDDTVFDQHMNTLFTITHISNFSTAIHALTLIFSVQSSRSSLSDRFYRTLYSTLFDPRLPSSSKHAQYLNLLYRSLRADVRRQRVAAFVKRIVQFCAGLATDVGIVCACLFMIGELLKERAEVRALVEIGDTGVDEEERFVDADKAEEEGAKRKRDHDEGDGKDERDGYEAKANTDSYDGRKRDPLYVNADKSCLWELIAFASHYHPTISLYARTILSSSPIAAPRNGSYDPLQNHTLMRFLERFVYKKPKRVTSAYKGASLMQAKHDGGGAAEDGLLVGGRRRRGVVVVEEDGRVIRDLGGGVPVNEAASRKKDGDIPVDELFFYQYFRERNAKKPLSRKKSGEGEDGDIDDDVADGDGGSDFDEDEVWKAMWKSAGIKVDEPEREDEDDELGEEFMKGMDSAEDAEDIDGDAISDENEDETEMGAMNDVGWDEDGDMEDEDLDEEGDMGMEMMGSEEGSDDDMELMIQASDDESEKEKEKKEDAPKRGSKLARVMAERAKKLGYKGEFFGSGDMMFADADEFEKLMGPDEQNGSDGELADIKQRKWKGKGNKGKRNEGENQGRRKRRKMM
ncbi:CBF/Mak21 family-domain-containing protein [Cladochytrium replicatum]|nr:CBF/Mak21 family-domain-containing protein [Cladochytrium replicatum]